MKKLLYSLPVAFVLLAFAAFSADANEYVVKVKGMT